MKQTLSQIVLISFIISPLITACSSQEQGVQPPSQNIFEIKGDPMVFITGTQKDVSGIPLEVVDGQYTLSMRGFKRENQIEPFKNKEESLKVNAPPKVETDPKPLQLPMFNLVQNDETNYELVSDDSNFNNIKMSLDGNGRLQATHIYNPNTQQTLPILVHHYSVKNDLSAFNLLYSNPEGETQILYEATFTKSEKKSFILRALDSVYNFLKGPGVIIKWLETPQVKGCTINSGVHYQEQMNKSATDWQEALNGKLKIDYQSSSQCPPFSDLNTQTILYVRDWVEIRGGEWTKSGFTTVVMDFEKRRIVDGDVFILEKEWQELYDGITIDEDRVLANRKHMKEMQRILTHETGHMLGLHHEFDEGKPAIMGYFGVNEITDHDRAAISFLYEEHPELAEQSEHEEEQKTAQNKVDPELTLAP